MKNGNVVEIESYMPCVRILHNNFLHCVLIKTLEDIVDGEDIHEDMHGPIRGIIRQYLESKGLS